MHPSSWQCAYSLQYTPSLQFRQDMKNCKIIYDPQSNTSVNITSMKYNQKVSNIYKIVICNICNFHRQNIQISKPDGGGIPAAKSLTGRHKNDTTPLCTRTMLVTCTTQSSLSRLEVGACKTVFCSLNWTPGGKKCRIFIWPSTVANCCWPRWLMDQMYTSAPGSKESSFRTLVIKCFENHYSFWHYYIIQRFNDGLFNDRTQGQMQLLLGNITLQEIFTSRKCPPHLRRRRLPHMTYCPHHLSGTLENIENRFNPELLKMSSKSR